MHSQRGIHPPYKVFYIEAMLFNTSSALTSVESINATLEAIAEDQASSSGLTIERCSTNYKMS